MSSEPIWLWVGVGVSVSRDFGDNHSVVDGRTGVQGTPNQHISPSALHELVC